MLMHVQTCNAILWKDSYANFPLWCSAGGKRGCERRGRDCRLDSSYSYPLRFFRMNVLKCMQVHGVACMDIVSFHAHCMRNMLPQGRALRYSSTVRATWPCLDTAEHYDYAYARNGTAPILLCTAPLPGQRVV